MPRPALTTLAIGAGLLTLSALTLARAAAADPAPAAAQSAPSWPVQASLDGLYVHLGPVLGAIHHDGDWDSVVGGALSVARVREHEPLAFLGARAMGARYSEGGGRLGLEAAAAIDPGFMIGASAGGLLDLADLHHPRIGGSVAIWCYAGVVPYVRLGVIEASGGFVEAGLEIPLPVWRH